MASICRDKGGRKRVLFVTPAGRKTIRLGRASMKQALQFKIRLENLVTGRYGAGIDDETARWLADLPSDMHAKLAGLELVEPREAVVIPTLGQWLGDYIQGRHDVKPATRTVYERTRRHLLRHFGPEKRIDQITPGNADQWRLYLIGEGLAENTIRRTCGIARQFFRAAVRRKLIDENPFTELKTAVQGNRAREYFLSPQDAQKILDACPDTQWRVIFALARYGGLRTPSETLLLAWSDIHWDSGKMLVCSPKTAYHPGGESRFVPIFPELRPYLMAAFEEAEPGSKYVISRYRKTGLNLRTGLLRIIAKAGLQPWPKLFQNLRATRETELVEQWPEHVCCAWLGNTRLVARQHYLQVTDEHFAKAAQNAAQSPAVTGGASQETTCGDEAKNAVFPLVTADSCELPTSPVGGTGLEPVTPCV